MIFLAGCVAHDDVPIAQAIGIPENVTPVFVATTRAKADEPLLVFSSKRDNKLNFAKFDISIPSNREIGTIKYPSKTPNISKEFSAISVNTHISEEQFINGINAALNNRPKNERQIFMFVHGYNNSFAEGLFRTAQLAHDYDIAGLAMHFSWPSAGETPLYLYDRDSVQYSRRGLERTVELLAKTQASSIVLFAHSMGTLLTMETLRQISLKGKTSILNRLDALVLASPDIDVDVFWEQLADIKPRPKPMIMFVHKNDQALRLSDRIRGGFPRIGQGAQLTRLNEAGIAVLDLTNISDGNDKTNHSVFASSAELISLFKSGQLNKDVFEGNIEAPNLLQLGDFARSIVFLPRKLLTGN